MKRLLLLLLVIIVVLSCAVPAFAVDETEAEGGGSINNLQPIGLPNSFKEQIAVWYQLFPLQGSALSAVPMAGLDRDHFSGSRLFPRSGSPKAG